MANFPNDVRETARRQGEKDADRGMSKKDCPYPTTSVLAQLWLEAFVRRRDRVRHFAKPENWGS